MKTSGFVQAMTSWEDLERELDAWAAAGRAASLWWRDDDAVEPSAALDRLLALAERHGQPLALAVIPARLSAALPARLARAGARLTLLQHGYAHRNHAPAEAKKIELGAQRPAAEALEELARGAAQLEAAFGPCGAPDTRADTGSSPLRAPVLVPPWNRIAEALLPALPGLGFAGISLHGARPAATAAPGLALCNTHVDIMRWEAPRGFLGEAGALGQLLGHLRARREGEAEAEEPSGLLTHHLAQDPPAWDFLERLLGLLAAHPGARLLPAREAFGWAAEPTPALAAAGSR